MASCLINYNKLGHLGWNDLKSIYEIRNLSKSEQENFFKNKKVKDLLLFFMDGNYLIKAEKIQSKKIRILQQDSNIKEFRTIEKGYHIIINIKEKLIIHDCLYWIHQCSNHYKLCKHVGKIFLILFKNDSKAILKDIILTDWNFEIL